jgi:hypothetical protein
MIVLPFMVMVTVLCLFVVEVFFWSETVLLSTLSFFVGHRHISDFSIGTGKQE